MEFGLYQSTNKDVTASAVGTNDICGMLSMRLFVHTKDSQS